MYKRSNVDSVTYDVARALQSETPVAEPMMQTLNTNPEPSMAQRNRAVRILAKSIFRELTSQGYDERQIVSLATELISEVTDKMSTADAPSAQD